MFKMSDNTTEHALMELLSRPRRGTGLAAALGAAAEPELAVGDDAPVDRPPPKKRPAEVKTCDDPEAPHYLTALEEGCLSPKGVQWLARHVKRCETCRIFVATLVAELGQVESTGTHRTAPAERGRHKPAERRQPRR